MSPTIEAVVVDELLEQYLCPEIARAIVERVIDPATPAALGRRLERALEWLRFEGEPEAVTPPPEAARFIRSLAVAVYGRSREARVAGALEAVRLAREAA